MGDTAVSKKLFFVGVWRAQTVNDSLLRQIHGSISSKKKIPSNLQLTVTGMELIILGQNGVATRRDQIPLENIVDFIHNKYSTTCTLAIVREKQQQVFNVFAFLCASDRDAAELIKTFKVLKQRLSGEGYNVDVTSKGKNWTLVTKEGYTEGEEIRTPHLQQNGNVRVVNVNGTNENVIHVGLGGRTSVSNQTNDPSKAELQEELVHLAGELRDIKKLLHENSERQTYYQSPQVEENNQTVVFERTEMPFAARKKFQESKGRLQFEKHYGYRILQQPPPPTVQTVQTVERTAVPREIQNNAIYTQKIETRRPTVYLKKNKKSTKSAKHFVSVTPPKSNASMKSRSTYYSSASVPPSPGSSNLSYTKRVYESANPYATQRIVGPQALTLVATNKKHRFRKRSPIRKVASLGSDIVPRNIEDVYKHRTYKRIIVPPPMASPNTMEYVNVQSSHRAPTSAHSVKTLENVEYTDYADGFEGEQIQVAYPNVRGVYESRENMNMHQNASFANMSTAVNYSTDDGLDDNVILRGEDSEYRNVTSEIEGDGDVVIIRAGENTTEEDDVIETGIVDDVRHEEQRVIKGDVYHVTAVSADEYERSRETEGYTVISADNTHTIRHDPLEHHVLTEETIREPVIVTTNNVHDIRHDPLEHHVLREETVHEQVVQFADDADTIRHDPLEHHILREETVHDQVVQFADNADTIRHDPLEHHVLTDDPVDTDQTIVVTADTTNYVRHDPLEHHVVTEENVNEPMAVTDNGSGDHGHEEQEVTGLFGAYASKPDEDDEGNNEINATEAYRYHDTSDNEDDEEQNEKNSDTHSEKSNNDKTNVRHVHYSSEDVHIIDTYSEDRDNESERANQPSVEDDDEDDNYVMDMDALKKSMEEPELQIVSSSNGGVTFDHEIEQLENDIPSTSGFDHTMETTKNDETDSESGLHIDQDSDHKFINGTSVKNEGSAANRDAFARQYLDEDAIKLITSRAEDSVLF